MCSAIMLGVVFTLDHVITCFVIFLLIYSPYRFLFFFLSYFSRLCRSPRILFVFFYRFALQLLQLFILSRWTSMFLTICGRKKYASRYFDMCSALLRHTDQSSAMKRYMQSTSILFVCFFALHRVFRVCKLCNCVHYTPVYIVQCWQYSHSDCIRDENYRNNTISEATIQQRNAFVCNVDRMCE